MCRNSLKQMLRTPLKTVLFLILISTILIVLGGNLFFLNYQDMEKFDKMFSTIGMAEQIPKETKMEGSWDAEQDREYYHSVLEYGEWASPSVLEFPGAEYVVEPEKMPWFVAYIPQLEQSYTTGRFEDFLFLVEVTPLETGTMEPLPVKVTKVLGNNQTLSGKTLWLCDHCNPDPDVLEQGKTYIMQINGPMPGHDTGNCYMDAQYGEYMPVEQASTQYNKEGKCIGEEQAHDMFTEVTPGFYETEEGKYWMSLADATEMMKDLYPVYPVKNMKFMIPFQKKTAYVTEGREITKDEYERGKDVCLFPEALAIKNHLKVGDTIMLPLIGANYQVGPNQVFFKNGASFNFSLMNAEGEIYQAFDREEYEIVGIYRTEGEDQSDMGMSGQEIVVPYQSVTNSWEHNILQNGPMNAGTTRFQIPNGEIDSFLKEWKKQGIKDVEVTFYDGGYSQLHDSIENRKMMAYVLLIGGAAMAILMMLLFSHLFISRQAQRTAVERSLGTTRRQCMVSIQSGMMLLLCIGVLLGSVLGWRMTEKAADQMVSRQAFDTTYTVGKTEDVADEKEEVAGETGNSPVSGDDADDTLASTVAVGSMILLVSCTISGAYMLQNLKKEPIRLLTGSEE